MRPSRKTDHSPSLTCPNTVVRYDNIEFIAPDPVTSTYTYNDGNELLTMVKGSNTTTFTYDDWGRQVSKIVGANSAVYQYRYGSFLKRVDSTLPGEADLVQYIHDGLDKRREVKVTDNSIVTSDLWYRYDMGWNAIATYDIGANGSTAWDIGTRTQSVTYHGMTPLAEVPGSNPSSGAYRHYLHDHLGSTRALYDGSKALLARVAYAPYGEQAASTAGAEATYTYTGKQWEEETGLYYFPYRYYSPSAARWEWPDPLGMVDGPNRYGYVKNNPIAHHDPTGQIAVIFIPLFLGGVLAACGLYGLVSAVLDSNDTVRDEVAHCVAGCKLGKCAGGLAPGALAYALNAYAEYFITGWSSDAETDSEAARHGADQCSRDCSSCEECCISTSPVINNSAM